LIDRVLTHQKKDDAALDLYERIERVEIRKGTGDSQTTTVKIARVVPAGTGVDHIPVGTDGRPTDVAAYSDELEKLEKDLSWAAEDGRSQQEAYTKIAKRKKDREDLTEAARNAFIFSFVGREPRADRMLLKYSISPNPSFKPTTRTSTVFTK